MATPRRSKRKPKSTRARKHRLAAKEKQALNFETLEARYLLAAVTVSNATDLTNADTGSITALIANDGGDGISLREAITAANNTTGEDTITFDGNVFTGGASSLIRLTQGELEISESLAIDASSATDLVITGDANGDDVTLDGTFITAAGTRFVGTFPNLEDVLDDNSRVINFTDPSGDLTINNLTLTGGNITSNGGGGGIRFDSSGTLTGTNLTVSGNRSETNGGGGISTTSGSIYLTNSTLSDNNFSPTGFNADVGGGAIYGDLGSTISLTNSLVNDNFADGGAFGGYVAFGGGVFSKGFVSLTNSALSGNIAIGGYVAGGGGLSGVNVVLTNSTVTENSTAAFGMAVTNPAGSGGGLNVSGDLTIINSIVAGNGADFAPDVARSSFGGGNLILENSLIGGTEGSNITATSGTGNILNQPAMLGPLADNGGPTLTHALLPGSPAINAGSNGLAVDAAGNPLTTDQRGSGFDRIKFGTVDIGAFESDFSASDVPPSVVSVNIDEGGVLARPDLWDSLTVVFDADVIVSVDALSLVNDSPSGIEIDLTGIGFEYDSSTNTATWDFNTLEPLGAGFYAWRLDASMAVSVSGRPLDGNGDGTGGDDLLGQRHVAIPGDANLDGPVDVLTDAFTLVSNLGTTTGAAWADGDFNADGSVTVLEDAFLLVSNLNRNLQLVTDVEVNNSTDIQNGDTSSIHNLISNDGGDGISLREAIIASNNTLGSGTINFDGSVFSGGAASVIRLTQGQLKITEDVTINGSTATNVVINASGNSRVISFNTSSSNTLTLNGLTITGGYHKDSGYGNFGTGGGISSGFGNISLISSTITGNVAMGNETGQGGGISTSSGDISLINSTVSGNESSGYFGALGAGIFSRTGDISLTNSTVSDNIAEVSGGNYSSSGGGGIYSSEGDVSLTNSTLSGNSAVGPASEGGGLFARQSNIALVNSTVTANTAAVGGGIFLDRLSSSSTNLTLENSILADNMDAGTAPDLRTPVNTLHNVSSSLIGDTDGSNITATTGAGNILNQSAMLGPLADNGGPTLTHALLPGSPAINAGDNSLAVDEAGVPLATDQRGSGFDRIFGSSVDIGAVELQTVTATAQLVLAGDYDLQDDVFGSEF